MRMNGIPEKFSPEHCAHRNSGSNEGEVIKEMRVKKGAKKKKTKNKKRTHKRNRCKQIYLHIPKQ